MRQMIFPFCKTAAALRSARPGRSGFLSTKPTHSGIAPICFAVSVERGEIGGDEIGALEQVARRVAAQEQFRRENEFRAARDGLFVGGQKFSPVGREIADGRVELEQANDHL